MGWGADNPPGGPLAPAREGAAAAALRDLVCQLNRLHYAVARFGGTAQAQECAQCHKLWPCPTATAVVAAQGRV